LTLGLTQPLTEMSTRNISWGLGGKGGRSVRLTIFPSSCADFLEIWEPHLTGTPQGLFRPVMGLLYLVSSTFRLIRRVFSLEKVFKKSYPAFLRRMLNSCVFRLLFRQITLLIMRCVLSGGKCGVVLFANSFVARMWQYLSLQCSLMYKIALFSLMCPGLAHLCF
jgi:hypothetical protein